MKCGKDAGSQGNKNKKHFCQIVAAEVASEHCGIMNTVVALTERARSARRANILAAMLAK